MFPDISVCILPWWYEKYISNNNREKIVVRCLLKKYIDCVDPCIVSWKETNGRLCHIYKICPFCSNLRVNSTGSYLQICQIISPSWRLQICMAVFQKCLQYQIKYTNINPPFSRRYIESLWRLTENANKIILETLELLNTVHRKTSLRHHNLLEK